MINSIIAISIIGLILLIGEILTKNKIIKGEYSRKFVHIISGCFMASWPWFMTWWEVRFVLISIIAVLLISKRWRIFYVLHSVNRQTYGEVLFGIGALICALVFPIKIVFMASILHLALADGLAALIGVKYGKKNSFRVLTSTKSLIGSATFMAISMVLMIVSVEYLRNSGFDYLTMLLPVVFASFTITLIELTAQKGIDNLFVPLAAGLAITILTL